MRKIAVDINILKLINDAVNKFVYRDAFTEAEDEVNGMVDEAKHNLGPALQTAIDANNDLGSGLATAIAKQQQSQPTQTPAPEPKTETVPAAKDESVDEYTAFKQKFENEQ